MSTWKCPEVTCVIHFKYLQIVIAVGEGKLAFESGVNAGNIMFVNIHPYFKTTEYIHLSQPFSFIFILADFGIQGGKLSVYRSAHHQVAYFFAAGSSAFFQPRYRIGYPGRPAGLLK